MNKKMLAACLVLCGAAFTGVGTASAEIINGIEWSATHYDFGTIREIDGPKTGAVTFVNKGKEATIINSVRPSCGCTGASYTDGLIEPGDTATVTFTYNPVGRPGRFEKTVKVYTGEANDLMTIRISGTVIGSDKTLERDFPAAVGSLRLSSLEEKAGDIKTGAARHMFVRLYNQSVDTLRPEVVNTHRALSVGVNPAAIPPGEVATLGLYVNSRDADCMGAVEYPVKIKVTENGNTSSETVNVTATIVPDTSGMSVEEIDNASFADVMPDLIDFSKESGNKKLREFSFRVINDGKTPMQVLRVYSREKAVRIKRHPDRVKPGKNGLVKGVVDMGMLPGGPFRIVVEVVTDDPLHPLRTVTIVGDNTADRQRQ